MTKKQKCFSVITKNLKWKILTKNLVNPQPLYRLPLPPFLQENLDSPYSMIFKSSNLSPLNKGGGGRGFLL